jgi:carbonic anhydrase
VSRERFCAGHGAAARPIPTTSKSPLADATSRQTYRRSSTCGIKNYGLLAGRDPPMRSASGRAMARWRRQAGLFRQIWVKSHNRADAPVAKHRAGTAPRCSTHFRERQVAEFVEMRAGNRWWRENMSMFSGYEYRTQPGFDMNTFEGADQAIPMKTLVIHCFDPRAAEIPQSVAAYFGDEVYPGENILDEKGNRVGSTRTMFVVTNAGGRAAFALESIAAMDYIFSLQNVVVVHHSFCGTTTLTPELLIAEFHDHHHADISTMFDHDSLAIMDFEKSIKHDIELLRSSPAVPKHIKLYGFFYEISSGKLTELARDIPLEIAA